MLSCLAGKRRVHIISLMPLLLDKPEVSRPATAIITIGMPMAGGRRRRFFLSLRRFGQAKAKPSSRFRFSSAHEAATQR